MFGASTGPVTGRHRRLPGRDRYGGGAAESARGAELFQRPADDGPGGVYHVRSGDLRRRRRGLRRADRAVPAGNMREFRDHIERVLTVLPGEVAGGDLLIGGGVQVLRLDDPSWILDPTPGRPGRRSDRDPGAHVRRRLPRAHPPPTPRTGRRSVPSPIYICEYSKVSACAEIDDPRHTRPTISSVGKLDG